MATTTINKTKINTVSFANAPQANGDNYAFTEQQLLDSAMFSFDGASSIVTLDVMSNDLGGAAKTLYSVDEGTDNFMQDLLASNVTTGWEPTSGGNMMRIVNGKIELDITNALNAQAGGTLNSLGVGDTIQDSFVYSIRMANGTLSWARVTFSVTGENDGPTIEGALEVGAQEDEAAFELDLLTGASDADHGDLLSITDVQGLEAGLTLEGTTLTVDPTSAAFQSLAVGEDKVITVTYTITDQHGASVPQSATITVTGTNDTPTVAAALSDAADEDDASFTVDLLAGAADVDNGAVLSVTDVSGLETGVSVSGSTLTIDPADAAFQSLAAGEDKVITVTYNVTDEHGASMPQSATITITGTNDAPTVAAALSGAADEDDDVFTVDLLAGAGDVDNGAVLSVDSVSGLEAGASVSGSTLTVDPADAAFQSLAAGEDKVITVTYNVTDEHGASMPQSATITITGTNDAPTVAAALSSAADEDDASFTVDLLAGAGDVDNGAVLSVTDVSGLEAGASVSGSTLTVDPFDAAFQSLALGEDKVITVTYNVTDERGASVPQSATITVTGTNDTPTVAAVLSSAADEDDASFTVDLLAGAGDVDNGAVLSVTDVSGLEAGVSVSGSTLTIDPSDAAFQSLAAGEDKVITVTYHVTDEHGASVAQSATITITGTNDTPTVAAALTGAADEDDASFTVDLLAGAGDVDNGAVLSVTDVSGLEAGVSVSGSTLTIDPSDAAFQSLAAGEDKVMSVTYYVTDEHGASVAQSATITITGTNDTPTVAAALSGAADEDDDVFTVDLLAGAGDVDSNAALSVTNVAGLVAGVSLNGSTLTVDPSDAAFQSLAAGEDSVITVTYDVIDGLGGSVAQSATITITGTNDAPTTAPVTLTAIAEDSDTRLITQAELLVNASDVDNASLTATGLAIATGSGSLLDNGDGTWSYTPAPDDETSVSFSYAISDGNLATPTTATMDITPVDDAPPVTDIRLTVTSAPSGNSVPSGAFAQLSVPGGSGAYTYTETGSSVTTLAGTATSGGSLSVDSSGVVSATSLSSGRIYSVTVQVGTYTETFRVITGTNTAETLNGASGDDVIVAAGQNDIVFAGSGDDTVFGQSQNDQIHGGAGNDVLTGDAGNDTFHFDTALDPATNVDHITDFGAGTDLVWLSKAVFSGLATASSPGGTTLLAADFLGVSTGGDTADAGSAHVVYDAATGNLYYDADGGTSANRTLFAVLDNKPALSSFDASDIKVGV